MAETGLRIELKDEYQRPCCANVGVYRFGERIWRSYVEEKVKLPLEDGPYHVVIRRGKQYIPIERDVMVSGLTPLSFTLQRLHDPKLLGFYAFDAHSHISRAKLGDDAVMDIAKMSVRARGEDWNVYFAGTPYDGENHKHIYEQYLPDTPSYREYYRELLEKLARPDYLVDPGGEFIKYRYGHIVLANFVEKPPVDEFRDPLYHAYERDRHVPGVCPPPFNNLPPSQALKKYRDENSFAFFAHPTSWWTLDRSNGFVTNIASTVAFDSLTGMVDAIVVQGYGADKPWYRGIWYALLNEGCRLTGVAETDTCGDDPDHMSGKRMVEPYRTYARAERLDLNLVSAAVRRGDCFASSGPLLDYTLDGNRPGSVLSWEAEKEYDFSAQGWKCCDGELTELEVVVNGETAARLPLDAEGRARTRVKLPREGYVLCILRDDAGNVAVANPVYVRNTPFLNDHFQAQVTLEVRRNGQGANGFYVTDECQDPVVFDTRIVCRLNPMSRIYVTVDGEEKVYDPFWDKALQDCFRYTYSGEFLRDYPQCVSGEVPPEAFRIKEVVSRLKDLRAEMDFGVSPEALKSLRKGHKFETGRQSPLLPEQPASLFPADELPLPDRKGFEEDVPRLFWEGHEEVGRTMARAFSLVGGKIMRPEGESGLPRRLVYTEFADSFFMWGVSFITMFGGYAAHLFPFIQMLDNFYAKQHPDGFICRQINIHTGEDQFEKQDPSSTGPNILALAEWLNFEKTGDRERLKKVYAPLLAFHRWLRKNRTWQDGSYYSSGWGCGMDNIPRMDESRYYRAFDHGHLSWIDTTAQQALNARVLLKIAGEIGADTGRAELEEEYESLKQLINGKMWNEADGFYEDVDRNGRPTGVRHIGAYWTLLAGVVPSDRLDRFLAPLWDEALFASPSGTRSLPASHPDFAANGGDYWRGGVWCITEYMLVRGLASVGRWEDAHRLACRHVQAVARVCQQTGTIWESYDPMQVAPGRLRGQLVRRDFVGFSGVTPIAMALEYALGISVKPEGVDWRILLKEPHGVENLAVAGQKVDLAYQDGRVTVKCRAPMQLTINGKAHELVAGEHTLTAESAE